MTTWFQYKAANAAGELVEGRIQAADEDAVLRHLHATGRIPIRAEPVPETRPEVAGGRALFKRTRVSRREIEDFTIELATLLEAGFAADRALRIQLDTARSEPMRRLLGSLHTEVRRGASLSAALAMHESVFNRLFVNMVRAGETAGALEAALRRLAEFLARSRELRDSMITAFIYPAVLMAVALLSVGLILGTVVPRFAEMFAEAGQQLPWSTRLLAGAGDVVAGYWWLFAAALAGTFRTVQLRMRDKVVRLKWDAWLLRLPLAGPLVLNLETGRFSRTLGTLLGSGVSLLPAINITSTSVGNRVLAQAMGHAAERVRQGQSLSLALLEERALPLRAAHMIRVGEESGQLGEMLLRVAELSERDVQRSLKRVLAIIEPVLILVLGIVIGAIVLSIASAVVAVNGLGGL